MGIGLRDAGLQLVGASGTFEDRRYHVRFVCCVCAPVFGTGGCFAFDAQIAFPCLDILPQDVAEHYASVPLASLDLDKVDDDLSVTPVGQAEPGMSFSVALAVESIRAEQVHCGRPLV